MIYVLVIVWLARYPLAKTFALMVVDAEIEMDELYTGSETVGIFPLLVYRITPPGVDVESTSVFDVL